MQNDDNQAIDYKQVEKKLMVRFEGCVEMQLNFLAVKASNIIDELII